MKKSPDTLVWDANRKNPISNPSLSALRLSPRGDNVLTQKKSSIWEIWLSDEITDKPVSTVAILLDIGHF